MKNKTDLSVYSTGNFVIGAGKVKQLTWYFINVLLFINPLNPMSGLKVRLLRMFAQKLAKAW